MRDLVCSSVLLFPLDRGWIANGACCGVVIVAGQPLDQPVVQYGPFVLNTNEQVYQAMLDFQSNSNGFERAKGWKSVIGKRM